MIQLAGFEIRWFRANNNLFRFGNYIGPEEDVELSDNEVQTGKEYLDQEDLESEPEPDHERQENQIVVANQCKYLLC